MSDDGHRYKFGSPSRGWPTFGPDGRIVKEPEVLDPGDPLVEPERTVEELVLDMILDQIIDKEFAGKDGQVFTGIKTIVGEGAVTDPRPDVLRVLGGPVTCVSAGESPRFWCLACWEGEPERCTYEEANPPHPEEDSAA